jgi:hypothetical protein
MHSTVSRTLAKEPHRSHEPFVLHRHPFEWVPNTLVVPRRIPMGDAELASILILA